MDPFGICDGMNVYKKVKEEAADFIELSHEFKAELDESTGEAELESVPWMKQECGDWYRVPVKQEWSEADKDATLKRRFGCEREPVVRIERLSLDKWSHCRPLYFGGRQLLKQIHGLAYPALVNDTGGASRNSWLSSSEVSINGGKGSAAGEEIGQNLNESDTKTAAGTDAACNVQGKRLETDLHLGIHNTESQRNLLASSQLADEAETAYVVDDSHSESSGNSVLDFMKCQTAGMPNPSFAVDADKSHLNEHAGQTTKTLNEISTVFSGDCNADEKPFKYSVCQRTFNGKSDFSKHNKIYTGEKPFECSVCRKSFSQKSRLNLHVRIHTGEKPFECGVCRKKFTQKSHLTSHVTFHTGEKPFECSVCRKNFIYKSALNNHVRIHTGEKPFECSVCRQTFSWKSYLTVHMRFHTGKKFECSVCSKQFIVKAGLHRHAKIHTGERPFECSICRRNFIRKSDLNRHSTIHTGEKPHECDVCRKKFRNKPQLARHKRIHTGEKPFECSVCRKKFARKSALTSHVRIHTGEEPFECSVCGKKFTRKSWLNFHLKSHW